MAAAVSSHGWLHLTFSLYHYSCFGENDTHNQNFPDMYYIYLKTMPVWNEIVKTEEIAFVRT